MSTVITEPGLYPSVSMAAYRNIPAINASALKHARRSMAHVKAALDGLMGSDTPATDFGSLAHACVLEPETIAERYIDDPGPEAFRTAKGDVPANHRSTLAYKEWCKASGKKVVSKEDLAAAQKLCAAVYGNRRAAEMLGTDGLNEVVVVWVDPKTGVLCKCRFDRLRDSWILDLKTTRDASHTFERQVSALDYALQAAFYRRGAAAHDGIVRRVGLIAVESDEPFGVRAAPFDDAQLDEVDARIDSYLDRVRTCQLSEVWPGYESPDAWRAADWVNEFDGGDMPDDEPEAQAAVGW